MEDELIFRAKLWPHGMQCLDCDTEFVDGDSFSQRLTGVDQNVNGEPIFFTEIICVNCALKDIIITGGE